MPHLTAIRLLTILGVDLGLDWDDELLVTCPEFITGNTLEDVVREHADQIRTEIAARAGRARRQFVGGPFNGKRHDVNFVPGCYRGVKVGLRRWAVYHFQRDGRAIFRGWATSEMKARRGEVLQDSKGSP